MDTGATRGKGLLRLDQRGSMAVFMAFLLPILLLAVVVLADIGQLVYEKIRLQNTVDAAALAAAAVQSAGLNEIADLNWHRDQEYAKLKSILSRGIWYDGSQARRTVAYYRDKVLRSLAEHQDRANVFFAQRARTVAEAVRQQNLPESTLNSIMPSTPETKLMEFGKTEDKPVNYWYYVSFCKEGSPLSLTWSDPADPQWEAPHDGTGYRYVCRTAPVFGSSTVPVKRSKRRPPTTYAAFQLTQPAKGYVLGSRMLPQMPPLVAYGAAKPDGGSVFGMRPDYEPILVRLRSLQPQPRANWLDRVEH